VAWATLPGLADAVRSVRFAQRLRGERGSARLLAPVLERTLERATGVAAALELRGLAGRPVHGDCAVPVAIRDAVLVHRSGESVRVVDISLAPGTLTVVTGPTGSGKSTLLRALSGLHSHLDGGALTGTVRVVGLDRVRVPVGLDLGHTTHREIAVAILAELVKLRAAGDLGVSTQDAQRAPAVAGDRPTLPVLTASEAVDPVCGMTVKADSSSRPYEFEGTTYYFCCPACRRAFERDPHAYLTTQEA
jgi:YHS domain-containing protein